MEQGNKQARKGAFILLLIGFICLLPLTGYSVYLKIMGKDVPPPLENVHKDFFFDHKLWFYTEKGDLLSTYECENPTGFCTYALNRNYDSTFGIHSHPLKEGERISLINNRFAFLVDTLDEVNQSVFLYDSKTHLSYKTAPYQNVNNYGVGIAGDLVIIQSIDNYYGVMQLAEAPTLVIPFEYNYLALQNSLDQDGKIKGTVFIANKNNSWFLIDLKQTVLTESFQEEIVEFSEDKLILRDQSKLYHIVTYTGEELIEGQDFLNLSFVGPYLVVTKAMEFYVYDLEKQQPISKTYPIVGEDVYQARMNQEGAIEILLNNELQDVLDFS